MPIKSEDALGYLDIDLEKYKDVDEFKAAFTTEWTRKDEAAKDPAIHKAALGKMNGILASKIKAANKRFELGLEMKDGDPLDQLDVVVDKIEETFKTKVGTLEAAAKDKTGEKALKEWETKYGEATKKYSDLEALHQAQVKKYTDLENNVQEREKKIKVDGVWERALGNVKFRQGLDDFTKKGFVAEMQKQYQVLFDDEGNSYAAGQDGKRIADEKKAQKFKDLDQLLQEQVKANKLDASNPQGGAPINRTTVIVKDAPSPNGAGREREMHPSHPSLR